MSLVEGDFEQNQAEGDEEHSNDSIQYGEQG